MKIFYLKLVVFSLLFCFSVFPSVAQRSNGIAVEGKINVQEGVVEGAVIQMFMDGRRIDNYGVGNDGRYKVELNYNHKYELIFTLQDNFPQKIVIESAVPKEILQSDPRFPPFPLDINLFKEIPGIDRRFSENTVLKIYYNPNVDNFISELYYNDAQIAKLIEQAVLQSQMIGKEADYLSKLTRAELAELRKEYNQLLEQAGEEYGSEKFLAALDGFKAASTIFPNEQFPKDRIAEINDLLGLIMVAADLDEALAARFTELIKEADLLFQQKKYSDARNSYNRALSIKPTDSYATEQIKLINELLRKQISEEEYNDLIAQADNSMKELLYNEAKNKYQDALKIRKNESYPLGKIAEIDEIFAKQAKQTEKQESYKQAMFQGDAMFEKQFYDKAIASYENALNFKPEDVVATRKIDEVKGIMKAFADKMQFDNLVKTADKFYKKKQYAEAMSDYSEAVILFADDKHVNERITEISQILELKDSFADLVYKADNQFIAEKFEESKAFYTQALEIKSDDKHSLSRVGEINEILASKSLDEQYNTALAQADEMLTGNEYQNALTKYNDASGLKPKEKYPKQKISEINDIVQQIAKTEKEYQDLIAKADGFFQQKDYDRAKVEFANAGTIKPNETYPQEMLGKIDALIAEQTRILAQQQADEKARLEALAVAEAASLAALQAEKDKNYSEAITKADNLFAAKDYENSRNEYRIALTVKPEESYPQQRIDEIGTLLAQLSASQKAYEDAVAIGDREFRAESFDASKVAFNDAKQAKAEETYPDEMIAKIDSIVESRARLAAEAEAERIRLEQEAAAAAAASLAALQAEKDKNYNDAITKADNFFTAKDYENSRNEYRTALTVKPEESYPQQRIDEIGTLLAQLSASQKAYEDAVAIGDREFRAESFHASKVAFNDAKQAKAEETYPDEMIAKIDSIVESRARLAAEAEAERIRLEQEAAAAAAASLAALQAEMDKNYSDAITKADNFFTAKDYENSRNEYRTALTVKPEESYPQQRIDEIGTLLAQLSASQKAYEDAVVIGDREFRAESFDASKVAFNDAKQAKAEETYPDEMIAKIDSIVEARARLTAEAEAERIRLEQEAAAAAAASLAALQAEKDKNYSDAITKADNFFTAKDYENSRNEYRTALTVKPEESYPQQRIDEIGNILNELEAARKEQELLDKNYINFIQLADRFFTANDFIPSKERYSEALVLKPEEVYPKEKIAAIEKILQQQVLDEEYRTIIVTADGFFKTEQYLQAKAEYQKALTVKSEEQYPKSQITKIEDILAKEQQRILAEKRAAEDLQLRSEEIAQLNEEIEARGMESEAEITSLYNEFIKQADGLYDNKQYNVSRGWYYKALDVKPDEIYPPKRINEINRLVGSLLSSQIDRDYQGFIDLADSTYRENQFAVARGWYNRALGVKANENYPKDQIKEIEKKIAERLAGQSGQQFENHLEKANKAFDDGNKNVARFWYKKALELRPNDADIKARLKEMQ